ncbi:MAG: cytochrome c biogenesis protein ResB, partial [Deltaproteobacteria bacterium]|nr:cytochrome c biogenesis protein ResB [Deltaproteobacteria bacterium]
LIDNCSHHQSVTVSDGPLDAAAKVLSALKRRKYNVMNVGANPGHIYAWKGIIGRFGSDVTHISLLLILLGAIVGSFSGFKDFRVIYVGSSIGVQGMDFNLRLDKFWIDYYESGQIKQYNSVLTVVENGKDVMTKQIWVNEPLYYKGIRFYQSSFGAAWDKVEEAHITLLNKDKALTPVVVKWNELQKLPGSPYSVKLVGYTADFAFDEKTGMVFSKSAEAGNPAINLEVYQGDKLVSTPWLFQKYPRIFPAIINSDYDIVFTMYRPTLYSGLSLNKDPGTNIVWTGTIVMGIGFFLAFFVYHRRVWIAVKETGSSTEVKIGGLINKNIFVLEKDIEEIVGALTASGGAKNEGVT